MMTKFILHGGFVGGNKNEDNRAFYREILRDAPVQASILLVPFAKDNDRIRSSVEKVTQEFNRVRSDKDISISVATKNDFIEQISKSDVVYFHGGVSANLLEALRQYSNLNSALHGKVVAGESAGANVWCKYFYSPSSDRVFEGLGLLPILLIPHYKEEYEHKLDEVDSNFEKVLLSEYVFKVFNI